MIRGVEKGWGGVCEREDVWGRERDMVRRDRCVCGSGLLMVCSV